MRRTVATLLVVASPLLMVAPVGASEARTARPAAPAVIQPAVATPVAPATLDQPATAAPPAAPDVPAPALAAPAVPAVAHPAVHTPAPAIRPKAASVAGVDDTAYAARLQADLCQARQIFCGLDHGGHYRAG